MPVNQTERSQWPQSSGFCRFGQRHLVLQLLDSKGDEELEFSMPSARIVSASLSICLCLALALRNSNAEDAGQKLPQVVIDMVNAQVHWDAGLIDPTRPHLEFVKFDEFNRPDGHFTRFRVFAHGAPEGTQYTVAIWKIGTSVQNLQVMSSLAYVNRRGLLLTRKPSADEEDLQSAGEGLEFDIGIQAADGEPIRFALRSKDSKMIVPGTLIPYPIESSDKSCRLSALLSAPEANIVLVAASGFASNADLIVKGDSAGEPKQSKHKTDANGRVQFAELPFVVGKEAGILTDTIETPNCSVNVQIPWGKGSYHKH